MADHINRTQSAPQTGARNDNNANSTKSATLLTGLLAGIPSGSAATTTSSMEEEKVDNEPESATKMEVEGGEETDVFLPAERPQQKNKRRCWTCKVKLELAQRELGGCKCGKHTLAQKLSRRDKSCRNANSTPLL